MEKRITATQAVRDFSELLNKIRFKGECYVIERSGKPVARMTPATDEGAPRALGELKSLMSQLPPLDEDLDAFARDLEASLLDQPPLPEDGPWES